MKATALFVIATLVSQAAVAEGYITYGSGMTTCGTYLEDRKEDNLESKLAELWLQGYLTRFARDAKIATISTDLPSMLQWIENYCRENPLQHFAYAAAILTTHLQENDLIEYEEADDTQSDEEDWTLSLYARGTTLFRLEYPSLEKCLSAGRSYFADGSVDRFDCGLNCEDSIDLTAAVRCEQVCNTEGCR